MMRAAILLALVAVAFAAPAPAPAGVTVSALVGKLCKPIADALAGPDFTTLNAALKAIGDVNLGVLPAGEIGVAAPTNAAFDAAFKALGVTPTQVLANKALLTTIVADHVWIDDKTLGKHDVEVKGEKIDVTDSLAPVTISGKPVECDGQTAYVVKEVIVPESILPKAPAPGPKAPGPKAPVPGVKPVPTPPPISGASTMSFAMGAAVAAAVAILA